MLALAMCFAMAVSAGAADTDTSTYSVTIYKSNGTDISMSNDAVAGDATVTQLDSG